MQQIIDPTTFATEVGADWVTPTKLRPLFQDDPAVVWLEIHGAAYGFYPEQPTYGLTTILETKGRQFEAVWTARVASEAQPVCAHAGEGRLVERVRQTVEWMQQRVPVIAQPALWWPTAQLYGVPDLLVLANWARERLPSLASYLGEHDYYLVLDLKCTSGLEKKTEDRMYYEAQVRLYSYMLGHIQRCMPSHGFIVTRDRLFDPLAVAIRSVLDEPLDADLAEQHDCYCRIAREGHNQRPWQHHEVAPHYGRSDERWAPAKRAMMARVAGGAVEQMWNIGQAARQKLHAVGITSLELLLAADPDSLPKGLLRQRAPMLTIMDANRTGRCIRPSEAAPPVCEVALFVDCEFWGTCASFAAWVWDAGFSLTCIHAFPLISRPGHRCCCFPQQAGQAPRQGSTSKC